MTYQMRRPTSGVPMWPIFVILGCFALVIIYLMTTRSSSDISHADIGIAEPEDQAPKDATPKPPPKPRDPGPGRPLDGFSLYPGWSVRISAPTPMVSELGGDVKGPEAKSIPAGSILKILKAQMLKNTKWYNVIATDATGADVGTGWVRSMNLDGQTLKKAD